MQQRKRLTISLALVAIVIAAVFASALVVNASGQIAKDAPGGQQLANPSLVWEKALGGAGDDRAFGIANTTGGFFVVGSSTSFIVNKTVAWIIKLDAEGSQLWNHTYTENDGMEFRTITVMPDGYLVVGNTFYASGRIDGAVFKLDKEGIPVWNVTLATCDGLNKLFGGANDGENILVAGLAKPQNASTSQGWLAKLDADGKVAWSKTFGGSADTALRSVAVTADGAYVAAGYTDRDGNGNYDFFATKVTDDGSQVWNKTYGGPESDMAYSVASATEGGAVLAGNTYSFGAGDSDAWIVKINVNGNLVWNKTAGGKDYDSPSYITPSADGGYLVAGTTFSFGNGNRDFWLLKVSAYGGVVWSCTVGRSGYDEAYGVVSVGVNGYVMAGWTNSIGAGGRYDFYVVKIRAG